MEPSPDAQTETPQTSPPQQWWKRLALSNLQIILIALIVIGGRLVIDFSQRIIEGQEKFALHRVLEARIASLEREQKDLEAAKIYYSSDVFVETWAHSEGKMVRDGEVLVIPLYQDQQPIQLTQAAADQSAAQPVWQIWWALFFDVSPPFSQP